MPTPDTNIEPTNSINVEKTYDVSWITSGSFGSRDAVLVFRTNILSPKERKSHCEEPPTDNNDHQIQYEQPAKHVKDISNLSDQSNRNNGGKAPPLTRKTSPMPTSSKDSVKYKPPAQELSNRIGKQSLSKIAALRSRKYLNQSLSSSDNSISSDCDEPMASHDDEMNCFELNQAIDKNEEATDLVEPACSGSNTSLAEHIEDLENLNDDTEDCVFMENMPAFQLKITYKFIQTETKLLKKIFIRHGLVEVEGDDNFSILWTGIHIKPDILRNLAPYQRVNHFPRSYELTRKDRLYKNIERMQHLRGMKHFDIIPQSFVLPLEYKDLVSLHNKQRGPWIVKPAASSRGRGIFIVNSPDQIPQDEQVLVSKYVADPLCIDGHKCDLRVYVLVTSFDPLIIYIYEEGLVRLATVKYDRNADNLWNPCMHLCNYSINKYHSDYIKSIDAHDEDVGHKWTLSALLRHLKTQGCDTQQLMINIEDLIIKAILSGAQSIISACRMFVPSGNNCFELYGFDILIDDSLKPWLLEVNLSPSMGVDSPLDTKVKACLVVDLLTCIGIPAYSTTMRAHYDSQWTRFRNVSYTRRTTSADPIGSNNNGNNNQKRSGTSATVTLTLEEKRIIRSSRLQNTRRGRFVRIFPTEDTMQRYGAFLDTNTGIPMSTPITQAQLSYSMIFLHNYNQMLFNHLYGKNSRNHGAKEGNSIEQRMHQYERALETSSPLMLFNKKHIEPKSLEEGNRLYQQVIKIINSGSEMTQLQARQAFSLYLDSILHRLTQEPRDSHEKLILKFLNRIGGSIKAPLVFQNSHNFRTISKARSAMIAKLLGDFLEQYNKDTESYVDTFDHYGMIPSTLFNEFLLHAQETDLESILTLHTNLTGNMPYLYNRCGLSVPTTPPIPSGLHGFLRALPAMVLTGSGARDFNKYDGYYKSANDKDIICASRAQKLPAELAITRKSGACRK